MILNVGIGILVFDLLVVVVTMLVDGYVFLERKVTNLISRWVIRVCAAGIVVSIVGAILRWR